MRSILVVSFILFTITTNAQLFFATYGGINDDGANYIQEDFLDNFILCGDSGRTGTYPYDSQGMLLKYDPSGNLIWAKTYGDTNMQLFRVVKPTLDGGFLLHGDDNNSLNGTASLLMKTNGSGDSLWSTRQYGAMDTRLGIGIVPLDDTTYVIASREDNIQFYNPFQLMKVDNAGNALWNIPTDVIFNGEVPYSGACMIHTMENDIAVAGTDFIGGTGDEEIIVAKVDTHGTVLWSKEYQSTGFDWMAMSISQSSDSGYIVSGITTDQAIGMFDMLLIRLNANGDSIWSKRFGGSGFDYLTAAEQTSDGGFIAFGYSNSFSNNYDAIILRLDANGDSIWQQSYGGIDDEIVTHGIICHDQGFAITGSTRSFGAGNEDAFILRTDSTGNVLLNTNTLSGSNISIYPNPFRDIIHLRTNASIERLIISDISGRIIYERSAFENETGISLPLGAGVYFCTVEYKSGKHSTEKLICTGE